MSTQLRFGLCIEPSDAFWVQIRETLMQRCKEATVEMVPIHSDGHPINPSPDEQQSIIEEIIAQELDVLIGWIFPEQLAQPLLDSGLPIIHLSETGIEHPLTASPLGLGAVAKELAEYLAERLNFEGHVVAIGGLMQQGFPDDGRTRLAGIQEAFRQYPRLQLTHIPTVWDQRASAQISTGLEQE